MKSFSLLFIGACIGISGFLAAVMGLTALEDWIAHRDRCERNALMPPNWQKISSDESWSKKTRVRRWFFLSP